jgi:hypothetical protein
MANEKYSGVEAGEKYVKERDDHDMQVISVRESGV